MVALFIFFIASLGLAQTSCPPGGKVYNNFCYQIANVRTTWVQATVYCHAYAMHLAAIETQAENDFVRDYVKHRTSPWDHDSLWLGGSDFQSEGHFVWVDSNTNVTFADWLPGNPSNGGGDADEHCIVMRRGHDFHWDDDNCESTNYFICKAPVTKAGPGEFTGK